MESKQLILITGGSSGIGKHLASEYLKQGASVIIIADGKEKLQEAHDDLKNISDRIRSYVCDVGDSKAVRDTVELILKEIGCPDILVNNAGFATYRTFDQTPYDEMERLVQVNLTGVLRFIKCFLPDMMERKSGHIVNVSSIGGVIPITPCAIYGASKYGLVGISYTLRYELMDYNIKIHLICPGRVDTPFFDHETFRNRTTRSEMKKFIPVEKVSKAIMKAVEKNRFFTVIPNYYGVIVWLRNVFPFLIDPYIQKINVKRIRQLRGDSRN